jgi:hypothetical protein
LVIRHSGLRTPLTSQISQTKNEQTGLREVERMVNFCHVEHCLWRAGESPEQLERPRMLLSDEIVDFG